MQGVHLRKYGVQTIISFELYEVDGVDLRVDAVDTGSNCKLMKDQEAEATCVNDFVDEGTGYSLTLTATEMEAAQIVVYIIDAAVKVWLDKVVIIETYGDNAAMHGYPFDQTAPVSGFDATEYIVDFSGNLDGNIGGIDFTEAILDISGAITTLDTTEIILDVSGDINGNLTGDIGGFDFTEEILDISGAITTLDTTEIILDVSGNLDGNIGGIDFTEAILDISGMIDGSVTGNVGGIDSIDVTEVILDISGNLDGNVTGTVTAAPVRVASGTIAVAASQTVFTIDTGDNANDDIYKNMLIVIKDVTGTAQAIEVARITAYTADARQVTVEESITFTLQNGADTYDIIYDAYAEAPGAGAGDWTADQKNEIIYRLGLTGTSKTPPDKTRGFPGGRYG